jgi:hypothetical protein
MAPFYVSIDTGVKTGLWACQVAVEERKNAVPGDNKREGC